MYACRDRQEEWNHYRYANSETLGIVETNGLFLAHADDEDTYASASNLLSITS